AADDLHAAVRQPALGGIQQRFRDGGIVDRLEQTEEARGLTVELDVLPVQDCGNAADYLAVAPGEEGCDLGMFVERMLRGIEELAYVLLERRHPRRIARVDAPGQSDELPQLAAAAHGADLHARSGAWCPCRSRARAPAAHITAMRLPAVANASSTKSMCSSVCVAISEMRSLHEFSGTAGGVTGFVNTPASKMTFQKCSMRSRSPICTGMIGVSLPPMS